MDFVRRRLTQFSALALLPSALVKSAHGANAMYRRVATAKLAGSSSQGEFSAAPSKLVLVFGQPTDEPWDSESLGAFYFNGPNDQAFAVYHRAYDVPRTDELKRSFWSRATAAEFSVGARSEAGVAAFKNWLLGELAG
jgi:hypothetical protein